MAPNASSVLTMSQAGHAEQLPATSRTAPADLRTAGQGGNNHLRPLEAAECSLCGIARPLGLLVPDGGRGCADIRWYCKDTKSCTERWTTALSRRPAYPQAALGSAAGSWEPPYAGAPAERLGDTSEQRGPSPY